MNYALLPFLLVMGLIVYIGRHVDDRWERRRRAGLD
jgi:hypothetical protein